MEAQLKRHVIRYIAAVAAMTAAICMASPALWAEEKTMTLAEITAMARQQNGELKSLREESGVGEAGKIRAGLYPNPLLDLEGATGALTGSSGENRLSIGISQEFLLAGKREKRLAVAESELTKYTGRLKDAERLLLLEVKTGFFDLLLAENRLNLANKSLELNNQLLQTARERLAAGDVAELDVNLARVEAVRSEGRKIDAEQGIVPARQRLLLLTGAPAATDLKVAGAPEGKPAIASLAELKALALSNRPDLQIAIAEKNKGEAELTLAQAERIPNLTAGIAVSREGSETALGGMSERNTDYLIGVKLSIPLAVYDRNQAGIREARARKGSAETRQAFVLQSIEREVEAAYARLLAAEKAMNIYDNELIPQLTENLKLVQEAYRLGEVGILAVIEEQKKFIEVNDGYLAAHNNWNNAVAKLEAAAGIELKKDDGGNK